MGKGDMNRIYKTICKSFSGETVVVSELAKSGVKGNASLETRICKTDRLTAILCRTGAALLLAVCGTNAIGQQQIYDDSGASNLELPASVGSGLPSWLEIPPTYQGLVYRSGGNTVTTGADLLINYNSISSPRFVIGGYSDTGVLVQGNQVTLQNGLVDGLVYGGLSHVTNINPGQAGNTNFSNAIIITDSRSSAINNIVNISSGTASISGDAYGGNATNWMQTGNIVVSTQATPQATTLAASFIRTNNAILEANGNKIVAGDNAVVAGKLYGGYANIAVLAGDSTSGNAKRTNYYTYSHANAEADTPASKVMANGNAVILFDNTVTSKGIVSGYANITAKSGNSKSGDVLGPYAMSSGAQAYAHSSALVTQAAVNADGNTVTVGNNGTINDRVYGGQASVVAQAGNATASNVIAGNQITSNDADARSSVSGTVISATQNTVTIGENTSVTGDIAGGYSSVSVAAGHAEAGTISNGSTTTFNPAYASVDATNTHVLANNNEVTLNGVLQGGNLYGGVLVFDVTKGTVSVGNVLNNDSVTLTGSLAQATGNTITVSKNGSINSPAGSLYGGALSYNTGFAPESYDIFTGNTLNYLSGASSVVGKVGNFESYAFALTPSNANTNNVLISAQEIELGANGTNTSNGSSTASVVSIKGIRSGAVLKANDHFMLMTASNSITGNGTGINASGVVQTQQGISLLYDVRTDIDMSGKNVTATILGCQTATGGICPTARVNPQLKALSEGYLAGSELVKRGADLVADDAFKAIDSQNNRKGYVPFVILSGQHNRYNSGSHIKSNDFLLTGGLSYQKDGLTGGAFLEAGWGSYDTYNSFVNAADVHGDGNDRYYGVGMLGRYEFANGIYADASLRFGQNRNKFNSGDIINSVTGEIARYNLKGNYASAHLGGGYRIPINAKNQLDLSAKYLWTRLGGKDAVIAEDNIHFDKVNSHRVRLNGEWSHQYSNTLTLKAGLGYEQEFDSKAKAITYGSFDIDKASVKGGTGILSLGATVRPIASQQNLTLDIAANGYVGKREGVGASVRMNYAF